MKLSILVILLGCCSISVFSQNPDINLLKAINLHRNRSLDPTFRFMTNSALPLSFSTPFVAYAAGWIKKDLPVRKKALFIGEALLISSVVTTALKYSVGRDRPFVTYPFIEKKTSADSPSFPSGHTSSAFSTATSLSLSFPKWYVVLPSYIWAGAVGYSRMDLGVHYPSDVLVGAIIGSASSYLCYKINQRLAKGQK